jgi:hypothetical protein
MDKVRLLPAAREAKENDAAKARQQAQLVAALEGMLERAKAGEVNGVVSVVSYASGDLGTVYVLDTGAYAPSLLGMLEVLKQRLFFSLVEIPELEGLYEDG